MKKLFIIALVAIAFTSCSKDEIEPVKTNIDLVIEVTGGDEAKYRQLFVTHWTTAGMDGQATYDNYLAMNPNCFDSGRLQIHTLSTFNATQFFSTVGGKTLEFNVKSNEIIKLSIVNWLSDETNFGPVEDYITIKVFRIDGPSNRVLVHQETQPHRIDYNVSAKDLF